MSRLTDAMWEDAEKIRQMEQSDKGDSMLSPEAKVAVARGDLIWYGRRVEHKTRVSHDDTNEICQAECSCGWYGPPRDTLWSDRKPLRDARKHVSKTQRVGFRWYKE